MQVGRRVLVLEKSLEQPDRIVGELLQPGGYLMLKRLGLTDCTEGIDAQRVYGYAIIKDGRSACVKYPTEGFDEDVSGRSFHHGRCALRGGLTTALTMPACRVGGKSSVRGV